jgi:hypothetical protein
MTIEELRRLHVVKATARMPPPTHSLGLQCTQGKHDWHTWRATWQRCRSCGFFTSRKLGTRSLASLKRLPVLLRDRPLPPFLPGLECHSGFGAGLFGKTTLDVHNRLRVYQMCSTNKANPFVRDYGLSVKFKRGWCYVGSFSDTTWHRIIEATDNFTKRDPFELYHAISCALYGATYQVSSNATALSREK